MRDDNALFMLYCPTSRPGIYNILHYHLFHGDCVETSDGADVRPLEIIRSGRCFPDVAIAGGGSLVVSSAVRAKLSIFENIEYAPVRFVKLVDRDYPVGDFSYYRSKEYLADPYAHDPETLMRRLPDAPELHALAGEHFEILVPRYEDIKPGRFRGGSNRIRVVAPDDNEYVNLYDGPFNVTSEMIRKYPIFQNGDYFLNGECAELMREFVNSPFYKMPRVV